LDMMDNFVEEHATTNNSLLWQEVKRMMDYIGILTAAHEDERGAYQLDSAEVAELDALILDRYDRPAIWISNLLCVVYGHCRPPMTGGGGEPQMRHLPLPVEAEANTWPRLTVLPNPATTTTAFTYQLKQEPQDAWLTVTDLMGRPVHRIRLVQKAGTVNWGIQNMAVGVYMVSVTDQGKVLLSEKLAVQR